MRKILILAAVLCVTAGAQAQQQYYRSRQHENSWSENSHYCIRRPQPSRQQLYVGVDFRTYFDNREYDGMGGFDISQTFFAAQITPKIGWQWNSRNRLVFGAELERTFGDNSHFISEVQPLMYYRFMTPHVKALAGVFEREELRMDAYPLAMMSDEMRFYENRLQGLMGRYTSTAREDTFVELSVDWCGIATETTRERFRILSAGRYTAGRFLFGYAFSMFHFAQTTHGGGVSDNLMAYPYVGTRFRAFFDFDIELGGIVAPQRIRSFDDGWKIPVGGQLKFAMSKWGVMLENTFYCGDGLMPYYWLYGSEFYAGERLWSATKGVYNRTRLGYKRAFFDDTLEVEAFVLVHYDGVAAGTSQQVKVNVKLEKLFGMNGANRNRRY